MSDLHTNAQIRDLTSKDPSSQIITDDYNAPQDDSPGEGQKQHPVRWPDKRAERSGCVSSPLFSATVS